MKKIENKHTIDMLNGPLTKNIIKFALPVAASSILQQLFNSADTAIAGKFGTADALAAVGIPAALQGAVFCIANIFIQSAINTFGSEAAAGSVIAMNFEYIAYYVNTAFGQATATFTSQNYASGNKKRCNRIFTVCLMLGLVFSAVLCGMFTVFRYQTSSLFSSSQTEIRYACERIMIILLFQPICTLYEIPACTMRGLGYSTLPAIETTLGICAVRIIWLYTVFAHFKTLDSLFVVFPVTWVITSVIINVTFMAVKRRI